MRLPLKKRKVIKNDTLIKNKSVEGRLNKGEFSNMKIGDIIEFSNEELGFKRKSKLKIKDIHYYTNFYDYLHQEKLKNCLPGIQNIKQGVSVYHKFYSKNDENKYGIIALIFES